MGWGMEAMGKGREGEKRGREGGKRSGSSHAFCFSNLGSSVKQSKYTTTIYETGDI